jgi:MFS family permease
MNRDLDSATESGRWGELLSPAHALATIAVSLGVVLFAFNAFLVSTALPSAIGDLGGAELLSWATSLYLILAIVGGASAATLMHRIGTRNLFSLGAFAFLAGTLATGLAPSMPMLLAGRALQGLAAGVIEAGCYVLIPRLFPSRLIPKVFGVEAIAWAVAAFGGPVLAGYLADAISWRAALLAAIPLVVLFWALVPLVVAADRGTAAKVRVPWLSLAAIAAGMLLATLASVVPGHPAKTAVLAVAALVFWLTLRTDGWNGTRLFPASAFRLASATGLGYWIALVMPMAQASESVFLIYTLQYVWSYSALEAGLVASVMALSWSGSQFLQANLGTPSLRRKLIWLGPVVLVAGLVCVVVALPLASLPLLLLAQLLVGSAFGMNWSAMSQTMMEAASAAERDATSAMLPTVQAAGYGIGAALFGVIGNALSYAEATGHALLADMMILYALAGALSLFAVAAAFGMVRLLDEAEAAGPASAATTPSRGGT